MASEEILGWTRAETLGRTSLDIHFWDDPADRLQTDVLLPDMKGQELSERIRSFKPDRKCLSMSGYTSDVIARQGILDEGAHFIPKPFPFKRLATRVRDPLGQHQSAP